MATRKHTQRDECIHYLRTVIHFTQVAGRMGFYLSCVSLLAGINGNLGQSRHCPLCVPLGPHPFAYARDKKEVHL